MYNELSSHVHGGRYILDGDVLSIPAGLAASREAALAFKCIADALNVDR